MYRFVSLIYGNCHAKSNRSRNSHPDLPSSPPARRRPRVLLVAGVDLCRCRGPRQAAEPFCFVRGNVLHVSPTPPAHCLGHFRSRSKRTAHHLFPIGKSPRSARFGAPRRPGPPPAGGRSKPHERRPCPVTEVSWATRASPDRLPQEACRPSRRGVIEGEVLRAEEACCLPASRPLEKN